MPTAEFSSLSWNKMNARWLILNETYTLNLCLG